MSSITTSKRLIELIEAYTLQLLQGHRKNRHCWGSVPPEEEEEEEFRGFRI